MLLAAMGAALSSFALAETIEFKNGTKIVGTIEKQEGGKVTINAELLGTLVVDASALVSAAASSPAAAAIPPSDVKQPVPVPAAAVATAPSAKPAKGDPSKPVWKRTFSVNGSYNTATYVQGPIPGAPAGFPTGAQVGLQGKQSTIMMNGSVLRATATEAITLAGSYGYAKYEPAGVVLDNWSGEFTFTRVLSPKNYILARSTYKVDHTAQIEHSFEQVVGYGIKVVETEATKLDFIPGLSEVHEKKGTAFDDQWILSAGFLERLEHHFNERVSLEQRFKYRVGVKDTEVWNINAYLGLNSAITKNVSLNVGATYTYDNTLGPFPGPLASGLGLPPALAAALRPAKKDQLQLTSGLEFNW